MVCDFARNLGAEDLKTITGLEHELGMLVVAFRCRTLEPEREKRLRRTMDAMGPLLQAEPAAPDEGQLARIRGVEQRLGLSLVAVNA